MVKFSGSVNQLEFNARKVEQEIRDALAQLLNEAAGKFAEAAHQNIPVWSGETASSLQPLAEHVGFPLPDVEPLPTPPNYWGDRRQQGRRKGQEMYQLKYGPKLYRLQFNIKIPQWTIHERNHFTSPTSPWFALQAGSRAFNQHMSSHIRRVIFRPFKRGMSVKRGKQI